MRGFIESFFGKFSMSRLGGEGQVEAVHLGLFGIDLQTDQPIDYAESRVFRCKKPNGQEVAVKVFDTAQGKFVSLGGLSRYQALSGKAKTVLSGQKSQYVKGKHFRWEVTPIQQVGFIDQRGERVGVTVSQFSQGPRLEEIWEATNDDPKYSFLVDHHEEVSKMISGKSRLPIRRLNNHNLFLISTNIKVLLEGDVFTLTVTDLAPLVSRI